MRDHINDIMKSLEGARGLSDRYHDIFLGISKAAETLRLSELATSKFLSNMTREKEQLMLATRTIAEQFRENQDRINQYISSFRTTAQLIQDDYEKLRMLINPVQDIMDQIRSSMLGIREAALYWETGISQSLTLLRDMDIFSKNEQLAVRLLEPSREYVAFIEHTAQKFKDIGEDAAREKALRASLYLTESQFIDINDVLSSVISPEIDIIPPFPVRALKLPAIQQKELLNVLEIRDEEDEEELIRLSPAANVATTARSVMLMVTDCNEQYSAFGKQEIFKPTTRFVEATTDIIWLLPQDKRTFADFIDCLYYIFYEGAGKDNLRYLKVNGGVLEDNDCGFIWCIKALRNKWLRHDPEHGSSSEIRRVREATLEQFQRLGLRQFPRLAKEFRYLHQKLLEEAYDFMKKLFERISERLR